MKLSELIKMLEEAKDHTMGIVGDLDVEIAREGEAFDMWHEDVADVVEYISGSDPSGSVVRIVMK